MKRLIRTILSAATFNPDVQKTLASMDVFEAFADSTGARVILQHSKVDFEKMPKAPNYLK